MSLSDLGSGIPLYFYFILFTIVVFWVHATLVSIPVIIISSIERGLIGNTWIDENYVNSLPNNFVIITNSLFMVILFLLYILFSKFQAVVNRKIDENCITPSDFTVMAFNIPLKTTENELKHWIENFHGFSSIKSITLWYDVQRTIDTIRKLNYYKQMKFQLEVRLKQNDNKEDVISQSKCKALLKLIFRNIMNKQNILQMIWWEW